MKSRALVMLALRLRQTHGASRLSAHIFRYIVKCFRKIVKSQRHDVRFKMKPRALVMLALTLAFISDAARALTVSLSNFFAK